MKKNTKTVFSTEPDWEPQCDKCNLSKAECKCHISRPAPGRQNLKVFVDRKGRKGKTVTVITGFIGDIKSMQKKLQQLCGTGGSVKDNNMELQGDQCKKIIDFFQKEGHLIKRSGG